MKRPPPSWLERLLGPPATRPAFGTIALFVAITAGMGLSGIYGDNRRFAWLSPIPLSVLVYYSYWRLEFRGMSDEAIAVFAGQRHAGDAPVGIPAIASEAGRWLPHRIVHKKGWGGWLLLLLLAGGWNYVTVTAALAAWGEGEWGGGLLVAPFVLIGVVAIWITLLELLVLIRYRPTIAELSVHPIAPGETVDLVIAQEGPMTLNRLVVNLLCQEVVSFQVGTNTRTERHVVHSISLIDESAVKVERGAPCVYEERITIPEGAMHSLDLDSNDVRWLLEIDGDVARYPDFRHEIELCVAPRASERQGGYR